MVWKGFFALICEMAKGIPNPKGSYNNSRMYSRSPIQYPTDYNCLYCSTYRYHTGFCSEEQTLTHIYVHVHTANTFGFYGLHVRK